MLGDLAQATGAWSFQAWDEILRHLPTVAPTRLDELTLQTWRDDKIVEEQFYYDPGQFAAPAA